MPHPKHKISKSRRDKRRTHDKLTPAQMIKCNNCGDPTLYHRVCKSCGYYRGKQAIIVKVVA